MDSKPGGPIVEVFNCAYASANQSRYVNVDDPLGPNWYYDDVRIAPLPFP